MPNIREDLKKVVKSEKSGNFLLLGRLMYASFYTSVPPSKSERDPKKFQYGATVLIPDFVDISLLEAELQDLFLGNVPEKQRPLTKWKHPILKTADQGALAAYADEYPHIIRPNSKQFERKSGKERVRPDVVNGMGEMVPQADEPKETYNGRWARVSLQPYWYPPNDGLPGVALGLANVQLLYHDDPLAGGKAKASSDFEAVEGLEDVEEFA